MKNFIFFISGIALGAYISFLVMLPVQGKMDKINENKLTVLEEDFAMLCAEQRAMAKDLEKVLDFLSM